MRGRKRRIAVVQGTQTTGKEASPRPGTTFGQGPSAIPHTPGAGRRIGHCHRTGRLAPADERSEGPAHGTGTGEQVIEHVAGQGEDPPAHRRGLAPITWPGSGSSGPTPYTIESARRARLASWGAAADQRGGPGGSLWPRLRPPPMRHPISLTCWNSVNRLRTFLTIGETADIARLSHALEVLSGKMRCRCLTANETGHQLRVCAGRGSQNVREKSGWRPVLTAGNGHNALRFGDTRTFESSLITR